MTTYKVLLTLKLHEDGGYAHPAEWNWKFLLDLAPGESVTARPFPNLDDPREAE